MIGARTLEPVGRRAWMKVDAAALAHNLRLLAGLAGPGARVAAVVKADAYGHGLVPAARVFLGAGASMLCVATVDEALTLRAAGIDAPVLLLYPPPMAAVEELAARDVTLAVSTHEDGLELAGRLRRSPPGSAPRRVAVHLEVETGLTRMGVAPSRCGPVATALAAVPGLVVEGLWSHLAAPGDPAVSTAQFAALSRSWDAVLAAGVRVPVRHLAASGGLLGGVAPGMELVRPGLALYGVVPDDLAIPADRARAAASLRPAMSIHARPIRLLEIAPGTAVSYDGRWVAGRPSRIMTLPIGYGDGYARATGPGAEVLVCGRRAPVVGSIAMDALMVDVTDIPAAGPDSEVVLLGSQGAERIDARELARRRTTVTWEVLATMARRIPRVYDAPAGGPG